VRPARVLTVAVAYFIRRRGDVCAVIELHAGDREEVVQDGLSPIEAEILCAAKIADLPGAAAQQPVAPMESEEVTPQPRTARQLTLKL
jgi:hypothetical protein